MEWNEEIGDHLNRADLILLLVSSDFIDSDYCYDREVARAMARHQLGEARVVPIILRDCIWDMTSFSKLQALPRDGKPIAAWANRDEGFKNIAVGIRKVAEELGRAPSKPWKERPMPSARSARVPSQRRNYVSPVRSPRDLLLYGPRIKIMFGPPIFRPQLPAPQGGSDRSHQGRFLQTDALIDLGAGRTVLTPDAVARAGLTKIDETTLLGVGGEVRADVYAASLQFPSSGFSAVEMIAVVCCELTQPLFHCLLGRDVLSRWTLTYDGRAGTWQIGEEGAPLSVEPPEGFDPKL